MTRKEFSTALQIADRHDELTTDESTQAAIATMGCAYEQKIVTINQVAWLINYQTMQMNGTRDAQALQELYEMKHNLIII